MFEVFGHRVSGLGVRCFCLRLGFGGAEFAVIGKQGGSTQWVFGMQAFVVKTLAGSGGLTSTSDLQSACQSEFL